MTLAGTRGALTAWRGGLRAAGEGDPRPGCHINITRSLGPREVRGGGRGCVVSGNSNSCRVIRSRPFRDPLAGISDRKQCRN